MVAIIVAGEISHPCRTFRRSRHLKATVAVLAAEVVEVADVEAVVEVVGVLAAGEWSEWKFRFLNAVEAGILTTRRTRRWFSRGDATRQQRLVDR